MTETTESHMETVLAFVVGGLFAAGVYLMLQRNLIRIVFGFVILSNATNLLLFTLGRLTRGRPPLIPAGQDIPEGVYANPLPQAMILTAIVISFGLMAFALVLIYRTEKTTATVDSDRLRSTDRPIV